MKIYTKDSLIYELEKISYLGWIPNARHGNHGGIGNTLEDLLGITVPEIVSIHTYSIGLQIKYNLLLAILLMVALLLSPNLFSVPIRILQWHEQDPF